jgi:hypothetical protein
MLVIVLLGLVWCVVVVGLIGLLWPSGTPRRKPGLKQRAAAEIRRI